MLSQIVKFHSVLWSRVCHCVCVCICILIYIHSLVAQTVKNLPAMQEIQVGSLGWEDPLEKEWLPTPVFLPREFHGQRSLVGSSPWDHRVGHN